MVKYSSNFKLQVVQDYYSGVGGKIFIAKKYGINRRQVEVWKNAYKEFGASGLQRKCQNTAYSRQFKLNVINLYLTSEKSYREIANELGMNDPSRLTRWVLDYHSIYLNCTFTSVGSYF